MLSAPIRQQALQAVVFRQLFPPPHDRESLSFFGGAPIASRGFEWPRSAQGHALSFLMQVDCSEVPAQARLGLLPSSGVLYFFLALDFDEWAWQVIHDDGPRGDLEVATPPVDLGPVFGTEGKYQWAWALTAEHCPRLLPKWPFEPVAIAIPSSVYRVDGGGGDEPEPFLWPGETATASLLLAAQGGGALAPALSIQDVSPSGDALIRPFPHFPQDWRAVQICCARLIDRADKLLRYPSMSKFMFRDNTQAERDRFLSELKDGAQARFDRAIAEPPFDAVPQQDSDGFWEWLVAFGRVARLELSEIVTLSIECSLADSAEAAARIPRDVARRVQRRHVLTIPQDDGKIYASDPHRMLAPPVDVQGNQWERAMEELLLLEISSNAGLGHHFGEGVYQFWIAPEDLAARRFDKVTLTSDAY